MQTNEIKKIVEELLNPTFTVESIDVDCDEASGTMWCKIRSSDSNLLIGRDGETLMALNHLIKRIMEQRGLSLAAQHGGTVPATGFNDPQSTSTGYQYPNIIVDVNDYQKKRFENIKNLAHMLSERAIFFKSSIEADPMSSFDRRIIHEFLSNKSNIKTESVGEGRERRVVIRYVEQQD
jgi:spoIIIJ-associated protein